MDLLCVNLFFDDWEFVHRGECNQALTRSVFPFSPLKLWNTHNQPWLHSAVAGQKFGGGPNLAERAKSRGYGIPHCSTVTAVSRVSVDKFLVSLVSNDHISYRNDFMLSLINTTWRVEWAKSYRITLCQHNYQLSSVALFVLFLILATLYETSVQFRINVIGAETQADLEVQYVDQFK